MDITQDAVYFLSTEDTGKLFFFLGFENSKDMPFPADDMFKEELDGIVTASQSTGCPLAFIPSVKEIILEFFFGDLIRFFAEILD